MLANHKDKKTLPDKRTFINGLRKEAGSSLQALVANEYALEIGGTITWDKLPREVSENKRRKLCKRCARRKALFRHRNRIRFDPKHDLCFECFRRSMDRLRAARLRGFRW